MGEMEKHDGFWSRRFFLTPQGPEGAIPALGLRHRDSMARSSCGFIRTARQPIPGRQARTAAKQILDSKAAILAVDVFGTGELTLDKPYAVNAQYAGFTFGYNRTLLAKRVHDILTAVAFAKSHEQDEDGASGRFRESRAVGVAGRGLCGDAVARTAADLRRFPLRQVRGDKDEMMLPGALKYGDSPCWQHWRAA